VELELAELLTLAATAASARPLALLISADLYSFDPEEFDALARTVGAARILVEDSEPIDRLTDRLREAVESGASAGASMSRDAAPVMQLPKRSGIRWSAVSGRRRTA
jgi:hypothetical protein